MEASPKPATPATRLGWIGHKPPWIDNDAHALGVALVGDCTKADVVHAAVEPSALPGLRRQLSSKPVLVFQLSIGTRLGPRDARRAAVADLILVESAEELYRIGRRFPDLAERTRLLPQPVDLDWYAPETQLLETRLRGRDLRRFRRFHRLVSPVVLYAGPFTEHGGLDLVLEAVLRIRERTPEARLAAIPHGEVDPDYRDQIERRALGLGHHGMVEWTVSDDDAPFWYACSDVVCAPNRVPLSVLPAAYAAAAGKPFVGTDFEMFPTVLRNGVTGHLLPANDPKSLQGAVGALVADLDRGARLGKEGRRWAEANLTPAACAAQLAGLWHETLARRGAEATRVTSPPVELVTR